MKRFVFYCILSAGIYFSLAGDSLSGIIIRHDRPDQAYIDLARKYRSIVHINLPDGEGTLISPVWVLTAAHVAVAVEIGHGVFVAENRYPVVEVYIHPQWKGSRHDLALLKLGRRVPDVSPAKLYSRQDEEGKILTLLGGGESGTGLTGSRKNDGILRAARNRVEWVNHAWIIFRFDPPETALDLEGVSGPGDSGGPAYIEEEGDLFVAGVSAIQSFRKPGLRGGVYGVTEYYTRVSRYIDWIEGVME